MTDSNSSNALGKAQRVVGIALGAVVLVAGALALLIGRDFWFGPTLFVLGAAGLIAGWTGKVPRWFRG